MYNAIEYQLDEMLDINGWDLQKALRLLHSSNPTLFEWNNFPIIYKTTDEWAIVDAMPRDRKADWNKLNKLFLSVINEN